MEKRFISWSYFTGSGLCSIFVKAMEINHVHEPVPSTCSRTTSRALKTSEAEEGPDLRLEPGPAVLVLEPVPPP